MLAKITRGNQLIIPKEIVAKAHLKETECEYVDVQYVKGGIFLKPVVVEERISPEQYDRFIAWAMKEGKKGYHAKSTDDAINYLRKRMKKD